MRLSKCVQGLMPVAMAKIVIRVVLMNLSGSLSSGRTNHKIAHPNAGARQVAASESSSVLLKTFIEWSLSLCSAGLSEKASSAGWVALETRTRPCEA